MKGLFFILRMIAMVILAIAGLGAVILGYDAIEKKKGNTDKQ